MAWHHIELVRDLALRPTSKLILFALATRADDEGRCWPSIRKICQDTGLARRTVPLHLDQLAASGAVVREARSGRANGLQLALQVLSRPKVQESPSGGQPPDDWRIRCIPHVQVMRSKVQDMHPACARGAPEAKREYPLSNVRTLLGSSLNAQPGEYFVCSSGRQQFLTRAVRRGTRGDLSRRSFSRAAPSILRAATCHTPRTAGVSTDCRAGRTRSDRA